MNATVALPACLSPDQSHALAAVLTAASGLDATPWRLATRISIRASGRSGRTERVADWIYDLGFALDGVLGEARRLPLIEALGAAPRDALEEFLRHARRAIVFAHDETLRLTLVFQAGRCEELRNGDMLLALGRAVQRLDAALAPNP